MATRRVFVDTNVWFSKLYGSENCEKIIQAHISGKIQAVISQEVLSEMIKNIREKLPLVFPSWQEFLIAFPPEVVMDRQKIPLKIKKLIHSKDQGIFASAIFAKVTYFITGNIKDFKRDKLGKLTKIRILTPAEVVKELGL